MAIIREDSRDGNEFVIRWNGRQVLRASRETLADGRRGHWLLFLETMAGPMIVERNQYSNDLMEIAEMHCEGSRPFGYGTAKFRVECSKAEYLTKVGDWIIELEFEFGGDWTSDYYEWENRAILIRKV